MVANPARGEVSQSPDEGYHPPDREDGKDTRSPASILGGGAISRSTLEVLVCAEERSHTARSGHHGAARRVHGAVEEAGMSAKIQFIPKFDRLASMDILATRFGWICHYCGIKLIPYDKENKYCELIEGVWVIKDGYAFSQLEHKTPECRGGSNDIDNLALSCPTCNLKKGTKTELEFKAKGEQ
jgi:hypothetical protein